MSGRRARSVGFTFLCLLSAIGCTTTRPALESKPSTPAHEHIDCDNPGGVAGLSPRGAARAKARGSFFDARDHPTAYVGPGREIPPATNVDEVRIAWFGPDDAEHPMAGRMWQAATLAVEEANAAGGIDGRPVRLVTSWSENPWGTGVKGLTRLAYDEQVWAITGIPNGDAAHLAAQIAVKARVAVVSPISTDKTTNLANVPWLFSCAPPDDELAEFLTAAIVECSGSVGYVLLSGTDHDSRALVTELQAACGRRGIFPSAHVEFEPGAERYDQLVSTVADNSPAVVVVIGGPADSGRLVRALRRAGIKAVVFGGPACGQALFAETAGGAAEGVTFPLLWDCGPASRSFAGRFTRRFGCEPDYTAAYAYDGLRLIIAAIRSSGLNRVRIADALRALSPWNGVSGTIDWDATGRNRRPFHMGTIRDGRIRLRPRRAAQT